jgi:PPK2 family polyphosphate:nucleotide phosphotransferase
MDYRKRFAVAPGAKPKLAEIDPDFHGDGLDRAAADEEIARDIARMSALQERLYAEAKQSLLIVLQALDAGGKDGVIRHLFTGMNPQGVSVHCFKQPTPEELAHDFLWRAHRWAPARGEVAIFNRSHYEDVLVVRTHKLAPASAWPQRYAAINDFERQLARAGTRILKFYLHISPEEQLERFRQRLDDPARQWKISESDYDERKLWPDYMVAYEEAIAATSVETAPWRIIPSNRKWFRNLAISQIVADAMEAMKIETPPPRVDLAEIRRKHHAAAERARNRPT